MRLDVLDRLAQFGRLGLRFSAITGALRSLSLSRHILPLRFHRSGYTADPATL